MGRFYGLYFRLGYCQLRLLLSVRLGLNLGETQAQDQAPSPPQPLPTQPNRLIIPSLYLFIYFHHLFSHRSTFWNYLFALTIERT